MQILGFLKDKPGAASILDYLCAGDPCRSNRGLIHRVIKAAAFWLPIRLFLPHFGYDFILQLPRPEAAADADLSARRQHPPDLAQHLRQILPELDRAATDHQIDAAASQRDVMHIAADRLKPFSHQLLIDIAFGNYLHIR